MLLAARDAIEAQVRKEKPVSRDIVNPPEVSGVFVTVHVHGALRGCIGFLTLQGSLGATIAEAARRAASEDPRFPPLEACECAEMTVDVTLLGPLEQIGEEEDFILGVHGLVLECHGRRGLLLPQVAAEQHWSKQEFLTGLCRKASLPDRSWNLPNARLYRFEGMVIRDTETDSTPHMKQQGD